MKFKGAPTLLLENEIVSHQELVIYLFWFCFLLQRFQEDCDWNFQLNLKERYVPENMSEKHLWWFVRDFHRVSRVCQQGIWWVNPVGNQSFFKGKGEQITIVSPEQGFDFACWLRQKIRKGPGESTMGIYSLSSIWRGTIKNVK